MNQKKILLTGVTGQLGTKLQKVLEGDWEVIPVSHDQMDLLDESSIRQTIQTIQPGLVINPAAYTNVDGAENDQKAAFQINGTAPGIIAEECKQLGIPLIHFSTDFVFDGESTTAYKETDTPNPINIYGKSKLEGEKAIQQVGGEFLIFRTSWVYDRSDESFKNFRSTIRRLAAERPELKVIDDQKGAPTTTFYIAHTIWLVLKRISERSIPWKQVSGIYHLTCGGSCSWYDFACAIVDQLKEEKTVDCTIHPIPTEEYPTPAKRPKNSILDNTKLSQTFGCMQESWETYFKKDHRDLIDVFYASE